MTSARHFRPHRLAWLPIFLFICAGSTSAGADTGERSAGSKISEALNTATEAADEAATQEEVYRVDVDALRKLVDEHMARHLFDPDDDEHRGGLATGAIVAAVDANEVLLAEGYGYADYAQTPIDSATTSFNIGSATTSLSAIPVFQAIDDGHFELDDEIRSFLEDFDLDGDFDEPVTVRHLLDHTAGFRESTTAIRTPSPDVRTGLGDALREHIPELAKPPGREYQHSHHGISLAAYLAENATGANFVDLLYGDLFEPLGMDHTFSVADDFPEEDVATGHGLVAGELQPHRRRGVRLSPVDGVYTTAEDAASLLGFLIGGNPDLLSEEAHRQMLATSFRPHPEVAGVTPGFKELLRGDQRWLLAVGESPDGFASLMVFSPDYEFGLFVVYNSGLGSVVRFDLLDDILDEFFPHPPPEDTRDARIAELRVSEFTGIYQLNRTVDAGFTKPLSQLMSVRAEVEPLELDPDVEIEGPVDYASHNVQITHPLEPEPSIWIPIADDDDLWRHENGEATLVVHRDDEGNITGFSHDHPDLITFHRTRWHQSPTLIGGLLAGFLMIFIVVAIVFPIQAIRRRFAQDSDDDTGPLERRRWLAVLYSVLAVVFFVGYGIAVGRHVFGVPDWATIIFLIPFVLIALAPLLAISALRNYNDGRDTPLGRLFYAIVAGAALLLPFVFYWWDLLGFQW